MKNPDDKIKDWSSVVFVNDGRIATQSHFNDTVVRRALEAYINKLLKANKYIVVSQYEKQKLNDAQSYLFSTLKMEIFFLFLKKNIIYKNIEEVGEEEIFPDELKVILEKSGKKIDNWKEKQSIIDGEQVYIRQGSKKPKGWQITIRGGKSGSFIDSFKKGMGYLLVRRNGVLYIPLKEMQKVIPDKRIYEQDTVDVYVVFEENKATLWYKENSVDVTKYKLIK